MKICTKCKLEKDDAEFSKRKLKSGKIVLRSHCGSCRYEYNKIYDAKNADKVNDKIRRYREKNKEKLAAKRREYAKNNPEKVKLSQKLSKAKNKEKRRIQQNIYQNNKRKEPEVKLRRNVSAAVTFVIKSSGNIKGGSTFCYVGYSVQELKHHLESLFEPWMSWDNYGPYKAQEWNDNDSSTWKWNIDHIIPQSLFPYTSLEDENFKKCWALENLRPLSAKANRIKSNKLLNHEIAA